MSLVRLFRVRVSTRIFADFGRLALVVCGVTTAGLAQAPAPAAPSPAMVKLGAMTGEWRGTSWFMLPGGKRVSVDSWEQVQSRLGGLVLFVEGRHTSLEKADSGRVVHHAAGMLYFDPASQQVKFVPVTQDGRSIGTWTEMTEKGMNWGFDLPNNMGKIKYEVDLSTPDTWIESGFFSRDGAQWLPTLQLHLKKVK